MTELDWAPEACTLPTVERPLREREFATLFASALRDVREVDATRADLLLDAASKATARDLAARETSCCSFFGFEFDTAAESLTMRVTVPAQHTAVLAALVATAKRDAGLDATAGAA
jgi:hypothetical protein